MVKPAFGGRRKLRPERELGAKGEPPPITPMHVVPPGEQASHTPENEWIETATVKHDFGISNKKLMRYVVDGKVRRIRGRYDGYVYSRRDLELVVGIATEERADVEEDLLGQAYGAIKLLLDPFVAMSRVVTQENDRMRARVDQMETRYDELLKAREELLDRTQERQLAIAEAERSQARKDKALAWVQNDLAPKVLNASAANRLVQSLEPAQIEALISTGFCTPEQAQLLNQLKTQLPLAAEVPPEDPLPEVEPLPEVDLPEVPNA